MGVTNIGTRNIAGFVSEFLLLGFDDAEGKVNLAGYDGEGFLGSLLC